MIYAASAAHIQLVEYAAASAALRRRGLGFHHRGTKGVISPFVSICPDWRLSGCPPSSCHLLTFFAHAFLLLAVVMDKFTILIV